MQLEQLLNAAHLQPILTLLQCRVNVPTGEAPAEPTNQLVAQTLCNHHQ